MRVDQDSDADAIRLSPLDNVATVLHRVAAGDLVRVKCGRETTTVIAREPIPLCHKISLDEVSAGAAIVKYGNPIGKASSVISAGSHVHVHNMRSARARATSDEMR